MKFVQGKRLGRLLTFCRATPATPATPATLNKARANVSISPKPEHSGLRRAKAEKGAIKENVFTPSCFFFG